uniref:Class IIb bacteriocin, lactobin A/cerein 7B family n=1 Tax=Desmonostoc muscorum PCC 7121 TaxID=197230 RepID=A0A2P0ZGY0_DESMC|nr:hypothetical protein [Desmonostoc muscorum PCC 7121]
MASIAISDIHPAGYDLLFDGESYMTDLNSNELDRVIGGTEPVSLFFLGAAVVIGAGALGYAVGRALS